MTDQLRQAAQQALEAYDKTAMNSFVQNLYDEKMQEGKHGHYETMFHVVHQAIKKVAPPQRQWVGLTDEEITELRLKTFDAVATNYESYRAISDKLKEKNDH